MDTRRLCKEFPVGTPINIANTIIVSPDCAIGPFCTGKISFIGEGCIQIKLDAEVNGLEDNCFTFFDEAKFFHSIRAIN